MSEPRIYVAGERVVSSEYGPGTVRRISANGALVHVYFDVTDTVESVNASSLTPLGDSPPPAVVIPVEPAPPPVNGFALDTRRLAVECLRQGLPPPDSLASWTFGHASARDAVEEAIRGAVEGQGSVLLVRASYGQGKSHLARLGRELASEHGLLTMHVELDGHGLSMRDGAGLVAGLLSSARLPYAEDSDHRMQGLAPVLRRAAEQGRGQLSRTLATFEPFLERPHRWSESEDAIETLEQYLAGRKNAVEASVRLSDLLGERIRLESLKMAWGTMEDRRACQAGQLSRIAELGVRGGAKGAFVVVDELDHDVRNDYDGRVTAMLKVLAGAARKSRMVLMLLTCDTSAEGEEVSVSGAKELVLQDLGDDEIDQLVHKSIDAFAAAFPSEALQNGRDPLVRKLKNRFKRKYQKEGWGPRFFVRATIEACDMARASKVDSLAQVEV